jgi:hypothetical protein
MKLNKSCREILEHRLGSDCIASSIMDTEDLVTDLGCSLQQVEQAVGSIEKLLQEGHLNLENLSRLQLWVLEDCLSGSTYFADEEMAIDAGEWSRSKSDARHAAADSLEKEIGAALGRRVVCARC